jgi:hypothetical protein
MVNARCKSTFKKRLKLQVHGAHSRFSVYNMFRKICKAENERAEVDIPAC